MPLTSLQTIVMIAAITLGTMITRFLPFFLFPEKKELPHSITFLGKVLPTAMMGMLVVYCLRGVSLRNAPHGLPELLAIVIIILLHKWKSNVLLSIGGGTAAYMVLVQMVF